MKLPSVKVRLPRRPKIQILPGNHRPQFDNGDEPEILSGTVQNMKASMPEERLANALNKNKAVDGYEFRRTIGAPRGMPGWKELDFTVSARGMLYAIEVDTEFTHRQKREADRLHDAIVLKSLKKDGASVFPQVLHLMGETDLADKNSAEKAVQRLFQ